MRIIDKDGARIDSPDFELGKLERDFKKIVFRYDITQYEQGHYETIAEYPNGGKDVEWVIDIPEEGHWVAYDEDDNEVETDIVIPNDAPHEIDIPMVEEFARYVLYTAEELAEIAERKKLQEEAMQKAEEQKVFLESAPERVDAAETGVTEAQEAIAELGVLAADTSVGNEELMDAVAELGVIVAELSDVVASLK